MRKPRTPKVGWGWKKGMYRRNGRTEEEEQDMVFVAAAASDEYPRLKELGIPVTEEPVSAVTDEDVNRGLDRAGLSREKFRNLFGVQTCPEGGMYPWDVEAVLERMMSGKLTGTMLLWD